MNEIVSRPNGVTFRRLKLDLLLYGVAVADARLAENIPALPAEGLPAAGRRVDLMFADGTRVNAPLEDGSPYRLRLVRSGVTELEGKGLRVEARSILTSDFHQRRTSFGRAFSEIGRICGGYFYLPFSAKAAPSSSAVRPPDASTVLNPVFHDLREIHEVLSAAFDEKLVEVVKISVTSPSAFCMSDIDQLLPYVAMIKSNFKCTVNLSVPPPSDVRLLALIYARGVDVIFCDLLLVDRDRANLHLPSRRNFSNEDILETLSRLVGIFPRGTVLSRLLLGWEPIEDTARAANQLLSMGAVPILNFVPPGRDRLSTVVLESIYDFLLSLHVDLDRDTGSRWMHSHLHLISDGFTPNDSLDIDLRENGSNWKDRLMVTAASRRALAAAWALRRELKVVEGGVVDG